LIKLLYQTFNLLESFLFLNFSDFGEIFSKVPTLLPRKYKPFFGRAIADHRSSIYSIMIPGCITLLRQSFNFSIHRPAMTAMTHWSWRRAAHCCRNVQPRNRACRYPMIRRRLRLANSSSLSSLQMRITSRSEFTRRIIRPRGRRPDWILCRDQRSTELTLRFPMLPADLRNSCKCKCLAFLALSRYIYPRFVQLRI